MLVAITLAQPGRPSDHLQSKDAQPPLPHAVPAAEPDGEPTLTGKACAVVAMNGQPNPQKPTLVVLVSATLPMASLSTHIKSSRNGHTKAGRVTGD